MMIAEKIAKPYGYWADLAVQRKFLDKLGIELGIKSLDDWHGVTVQEVYARGGSGLLCRYKNSLINALRAKYQH